MREENFWYKKPRYGEVRVITRRVIARYDCRIYFGLNMRQAGHWLEQPICRALSTDHSRGRAAGKATSGN